MRAVNARFDASLAMPLGMHHPGDFPDEEDCGEYEDVQFPDEMFRFEKRIK